MSDRIILFDFEVFEYDTLLGSLIIDNDDSEPECFQSWDRDEQIQFFNDHKDDFWIGHNNKHYDNLILEAIVNGKNPKEISRQIVEQGKKLRCHLKFKYYDLMGKGFYSLKVTEAAAGKNISESKVDFTMKRHLTEEEKLLTESYNRDDLYQTFDNLNDPVNAGYMSARLNLIAMFNLPTECLTLTETQVAASVLKAKQVPEIEHQMVKPIIYDTLQLNNKELMDYYLAEDFRTKKKCSFMLCGAEHKCGSGGIHAALPKYHTKKAMYFDVSGYYNLIMLNYDLLPRTMDATSKEIYRELYYKQLEYKKTAPYKRWALKVVLLAVFGSMMNEYTDFYDPQRGLLVTITGQIFIVDLLEKLEGLVKVVQSNTDGIIVEPYDWSKKDEVIKIVEEWENRTGFVIKKEMIYNVFQRDVNCYFYTDESGEHVTIKGEAVKDYDRWQNLFTSCVFNSKEPPIIAQCICDYYLYNKLPEQVINEHAHQLRMFQYICKPQSFDYLDYEKTHQDGRVEIEHLQQHVNRAFAMANDEYTGMIYKKRDSGKVTKTKVSNLPDSVFVYNNEILSDEAVNKLMPQIDYQYYIERGYERILEFCKTTKIKDILI